MREPTGGASPTVYPRGPHAPRSSRHVQDLLPVHAQSTKINLTGISCTPTTHTRTSSAPCCASTTRPLWTPSPPGPTACRRPEARELLKTAPTPPRAARLTRTQLQAALKRAGRKRSIAAEADRIRDIFRAEWAHQPSLVEDALGKQLLALLMQLDAACTAAHQLAEAVEDAFPQHPDAEILLSFPGLGIQLAARIPAEIGDDRARFADARGLKAYAGSSPITRTTGKKSSTTRRWVKNDRLNHAGYLWAFAAPNGSPGAKAHYRRRRDEHGDRRAAALRNLFNRMLGQLYHCRQRRELFDERTAFPTELATAA